MESNPEIATESRMVYVDCVTNMPRAVVATVAQVIGIYAAQQRVDHWFNNYVELIFDKETGEVIMYKHRTRGYWEPNGNSLEEFKHKG